MELQFILNFCFACAVLLGALICRKLFKENDELRRRMFDLENKPPQPEQKQYQSKTKSLPEKYR